MKMEWNIIEEYIQPNKTVLDLGCGDGELLYRLKQKKTIKPYGVEIEYESFLKALSKGIPVIMANIDDGLKIFHSRRFDYVIISETLQQLKKPCEALNIALDIGKEVILAFENFGLWSIRCHLLFKGEVPQIIHKPYYWYNTPNIHLFTIKDFYKCCKDQKVKINKKIFISSHNTIFNFVPNLFARTAIFFLSRS